MTASVAQAIQARMRATGIGLAGIAGCWWLPAAEPFALPAALADELADDAAAIFALLDALGELYGAQGELTALLGERVPPTIPRLHEPSAALCVRPDFQLVPIDDHTRYRLVATELEICPSAHGFAHAMQLAYGQPADLADAFARLLAGRELLIVATSQWSEFLFDQLAFCRALAERGARARVLLDIPLAELARHIRAGECWQPPMFGIRTRPPGWNDDLLARIEAGGLADHCYPHAEAWPDAVGDAVVFRFGYFDCFGPARLARMRQWQARGATFLNPLSFIYDSKAVLAAPHIPELRRAIELRRPGALAALERCLPETRLLRPGLLPQLRAEQPAWLIKYAGFDQGNQAWGGRSLQAGAQLAPAEWANALDQALALGWPVVAQRIAPTALANIAYVMSNNEISLMRGGRTRLRSFFLRARAGERPTVAGTHLTVAGGALQVSESTEAVQAPVIFCG